MTAMRDLSAEKQRAVKMLEVVDALMALPGEQFTIDDLIHRFGSTEKKITKLAEKAANGALIRKGRNTAGHVVYWALTAAERDRYERFSAPTGELKGEYTEYLYSHGKTALAGGWQRR